MTGDAIASISQYELSSKEHLRRSADESNAATAGGGQLNGRTHVAGRPRVLAYTKKDN